jgi:hypothetical protein
MAVGLRKGTGKRGRKGFLILKQRIQTRFKHKFEFNQPKINAPACMQ